MLDHIGIDVQNYEKSKAFYKAVLAPLGYELIMEIQGGRASVSAENLISGYRVGNKQSPVFMSRSEVIIEQRFVRSTKPH
jgi:catechol 2,3-dioxygenase-like lactoylglutathione lyase family enzyme